VACDWMAGFRFLAYKGLFTNNAESELPEGVNLYCGTCGTQDALCEETAFYINYYINYSCVQR
jgi:hypothetical protein